MLWERILEEKKKVYQTYEVSPLELIFDLIVVFACSELTKHLLEHFNILGVIEAMIMLIAVYNLWTYTSFGATLIHNRRMTSRWMVLSVMLLGIFLNSGIEKAFGENPWIFVVPYLSSQLGQGIFTMIFGKGEGLKYHYRILTLWNLATAPIWIIGAFMWPEARVVFWGIAAFIDLIGLWFAHPAPGKKRSTENVEFDAKHMLERCRLFLIIALGEVVFTLIEALIESPVGYMTIILGVASFITIVSMWALYFWGADHLVARHFEKAKDAIRTAHLSMNGLFITVAGLILFSVGMRIIIEHPLAHNTQLLNGILFTGPILYLAAQGWYMWYVVKKAPWARAAASVALAVFGILNLQWHSYISLLLVMSVMMLLTFTVVFMNKREAGPNPV